jgi:long-chain acyl-CoA synthetase
MLLGEGRPFVSAVVFVAADELTRLASAGKVAAEVLLPGVRAALATFSEHEKPKKLLVIPGAPTDYPELMTPTLKVKREAAVAFLGDRLAALYA